MRDVLTRAGMARTTFIDWLKVSMKEPVVQAGEAMVVAKLRHAGLRPTRQRVSLARLLFGVGDRHVTAEELHDEAVRARVPVSLATVYNTLNQFTRAGLLREVAVEGAKTYFDTNTSNHYHFFIENSGTLLDIESEELQVVGVPSAPEGTSISRIDVIIRLARES